MPYPIRNTQKSVREVVASPIPITFMVEKIDLVAKKFVASLNEAALKNFNGRLERGLELAKKGTVSPVAGHPRRFQVHSLDATNIYEVDLDAKTCTCPDSQKGNSCKHRVAAYYYEQANKLSPTVSSPAANTMSTSGKIPKMGSVSCSKPEDTQIPKMESLSSDRLEVSQIPKMESLCVLKTEVSQIPKMESLTQSLPIPPTEKVDPSSILSRTEQILAELGFPPEPHKTITPAAQLGTLYRRYLHGNNLEGRENTVTIHHVTKERVIPHPSQPPVEKWCLWVDGLPAGLANGILFGTRGEEDLMAIFGQVEITSLQGKSIVIYPKSMNVAGQAKVSIRFRGVR
jgi:hypothetical protein